MKPETHRSREPFACVPQKVTRFLSASHATAVEFAFVNTVYSFQSKQNPKPWPSIATIARRAGLDRRRAWEARKSLGRDGILPVEKKVIERGPHAGQEGNSYDLPALEKLAAEKPEGVKRTKRHRHRDLIRFGRLGISSEDPGRGDNSRHGPSAVAGEESRSDAVPRAGPAAVADRPEPGLRDLASDVDAFLRSLPAPDSLEEVQQDHPNLMLKVQARLEEYGRPVAMPRDVVFSTALEVISERRAKGKAGRLDTESLAMATVLRLHPSIKDDWEKNLLAATSAS